MLRVPMVDLISCVLIAVISTTIADSSSDGEMPQPAQPEFVRGSPIGNMIFLLIMLGGCGAYMWARYCEDLKKNQVRSLRKDCESKHPHAHTSLFILPGRVLYVHTLR